MIKNKKRKKNKKKQYNGFIDFIKQNKVLIIIIAILLLIILFSFGTKIFLLTNFLLGNDIIVKLNADKEFLFLERNQEETIVFEASVTTNPFCKAVCSSTFKDISKNTIIEQDKFTLKPSINLQKKYTLKATSLGYGIELYSFSMDCSSPRTFLCHTDEELTKRNILITVEYHLNYEDKQLKSELEPDLETLKTKLSELGGKKQLFENIIYQLNESIILNENLNINNIQNRFNEHIKEIKTFQDIWEKQDYALLALELENLNKEISETEKQFEGFNKSILAVIYPYSVIVEEIGKAEDQLRQLYLFALINQEKAPEINRTIKEFNSALTLFKQKSSLEQKKKIVGGIMDETKDITSSTNKEFKKEVLKQELQLDIEYDTLCKISGSCTPRPSIEERSKQKIFELNTTCRNIDKFRDNLLLLNSSMKNAYVKEKYLDNEDFIQNISAKVKNIRQNVTEEYLNSLPSNEENTEIIQKLLVRNDLSETKEYSEYDLIPIMISELIKQMPLSCYSANPKIDLVKSPGITKITINKSAQIPLEIEFKEPLPQCCAFGKCEVCCVSEECREKNDVVIFLHGHSLNKDTSAEYSLDAFNKIQEKLEEANYLNGGAISTYTERDSPRDIWNKLPVPLTIKASYYFDIFREPENYIVVQTKSENINTYALRLKELIETVQYKTGKQKVIIIAHSMGGLVARRYIQIFGEDKIEKLILIGTPNKGIAGNTADYCPWIGEQLECRDMNSDSLFINKMNQQKNFEIPVYNLVGTGCKMDSDKGDGIVLEKNAMMDNAKNFIINGTCKGLEKLHTKLLDIDTYPEVYFVIQEALKE